ncbi:MAG: hypothetical protein FDX30_08090 [Chlorobium sp.]|nr:MAG: hypothetical protein FDX30_08090 [Chlorobium sp.]
MPRQGSPERREILDAVRKKVLELHRIDVVFRVGQITISRGWGWVHTSTESRVGKQRYEDFYALLRKNGGLYLTK